MIFLLELNQTQTPDVWDKRVWGTAFTSSHFSGWRPRFPQVSCPIRASPAALIKTFPGQLVLPSCLQAASVALVNEGAWKTPVPSHSCRSAPRCSLRQPAPGRAFPYCTAPCSQSELSRNKSIQGGL